MSKCCGFLFRVLGTEIQPKAKNDTPKYEVQIKSGVLKILEVVLASFKWSMVSYKKFLFGKLIPDFSHVCY